MFDSWVNLVLTIQYAAEIMPNAIRTVGCAVSYMALHLMIIVLVQVTPLAVEAISWRYFLIFLICSSIFAVMFYFLYPETQGKTLEDIEAIFGDKASEMRSSIRPILTSADRGVVRSSRREDTEGRKQRRIEGRGGCLARGEISRKSMSWRDTRDACRCQCVVLSLYEHRLASVSYTSSKRFDMKKPWPGLRVLLT